MRHVPDWLVVASVWLVFLGKDFAARHENGCTFTNLPNSLKWIFLQRNEKQGWHFADHIFILFKQEQR